MNLFSKLRSLEKAATPGRWVHEDKVVYTAPDQRMLDEEKIWDSGTRGNGEFIAAARNDLPKMLQVIDCLVEALEFYGNTEAMYDTYQDSRGETVAYARGIDPYDDSDLEKIEGIRTLHHGKRAREALQKAREIAGEK